MELYKKYRPTKFNQIKGQKEVKEILRSKLRENDLPQNVLLCGPTGTGKTTLAYIIRERLGCISHDFIELNAADDRGIDTIRDIKRTMSLSPLGSPCRIWLLDECHHLTTEAQTALLKLLEDIQPKARFFLATTSPEQLLPAVVGRCMKLELKRLTDLEISELISNICTVEEIELDNEVIDKIAQVANGSARAALSELDKVRIYSDKESQLECLSSSSVETFGINLARILMNKKSSWEDVIRVMNGMTETPEKVRYVVLGYAAAVLGKKRDHRAYQIITAFRDSVITSGKAGLLANCYEIILKE